MIRARAVENGSVKGKDVLVIGTESPWVEARRADFPYYVVLYSTMQSVLIMYCFICKVSLLCSALYAKCPYFVVLYMQRVLIMQCFICNVSLLFSALYSNFPYFQPGPLLAMGESPIHVNSLSAMVTRRVYPLTNTPVTEARVYIHAKNATPACFSLFLAQYSRSW